MVSQQTAHVNVVPAVSASFCMHSTCTTYQTICRVMRTCICSLYYQIVCSRVFLPVNRVTSGDSASTAPKPIYAQVSLTCLCLFKDHFLIVWSMNELSSVDSLSGLVVLPEARECGCGPARAESPIWGYRSVTSAGLYIKDNSQS
jgi:hypothetical protein